LVQAVPGVLMLAVAATDLLLGPEVVISLVVVGPVLAASIAGPRVTAAHAVVALLLAALLGYANDLYREDAELAAQLVRLVGVATGGVIAVAASAFRVERERRLLAVTRVAEAAQRAILIPVPERIGPVDIAVRYESAASDALVGGDLYGVVDTPFGPRMVVGDVRGKGLAAVRLSAQVLAAFRERANDSADLSVLLQHMDRAVQRFSGSGPSEDFVTVALAQVDRSGRLTLALAGHPAPLLVRAGRLRWLEPPAARPPLGLGGAAVVDHVDLEPGDRLLLYTDGLTEARRPDDRRFFPEDTIASALAEPDPFVALATLREQLLDWGGGTLADDVAMVLADYRPDGVADTG
jgi:serine phosphatase RsbU (regulator of sigma subunit)